MRLSIAKLKRAAMAEKRKAAALLTLGCFALLLWGRLLLKNDGLRTAVAQPNSIVMKALLGETGADKSKTAIQRVVEVEMTDQVNRDLFHFQSSYYPHVENSDANVIVAEKSGNEATDEVKKQQARELAVRVAVRSLVLQSTLTGNETQALINGELYRPGESVQGFEVVEVRPRQVTLRKDGIEIILEM